MRCALIPARGGSRRIPRKNIRVFKGHPIIYWSIVAARCVFNEDVWVSTDDEEIADVARGYGAKVFTRNRDDGVRGTNDVAKEFLRSHPEYTECAVIYPCAPLIEADFIWKAVDTLGFADYVVPVAKWLEDPGMFYYGRADAFIEDRPLIGPMTRMVQIPEGHGIDINDETDWLQAEKMWEELYE